MVNGNGKGKWTMWLAGIIFTIIVVLILPAMAKGIVDNDIRNTQDHVKIRSETEHKDKELKHEILGEIKEMRTEQKVLTMNVVKIQTILERWEPVN